MKKTILASFVAFAAVGAHATEVSEVKLPTVELYGQVGASVDALDQGGESVTDFNAVRNTEFGIKGSTTLNPAFDLSYDVRLSVDEDAEGVFVDPARYNVTIAHDKFFVTAGKAESSYDNSTRKMDVFSSTFTSDFELFDGVAAEEMITLGVTPVAGLKVAVDISGENLGDTIAVGATYSAHGFDLGAGYSATDVDAADTESGEKEDYSSYRLGLGFDFGTVGVAGLYAGIAHEATEDNSGAAKEESDITSMTVGYSVTPALTLSAGYAMGSDVDSKDVDTMRFAADYALSSELTLKAGYAQIDAEAKADKDSILTAGFIYKF